jgi:spore maturation protein CgeB
MRRKGGPPPGSSPAAGPLRILVIGPIYGGSLPVARSCAAAFTRLGHHVSFMDCSRYESLLNHIQEGFHDPALCARAKNALIGFLSELALAEAQEFHAQLVFALAQAPLTTNAVSQIRAKGILTAFWFVENYRLFQYWRQTAPAYDFFFTIQQGAFFNELDALGVTNYACVPTGCDPTVHRPLQLDPTEQKIYGSDISFAGAAYPNRIAAFESLVDKQFKLWGIGWDTSPALRPLDQKNGQPFSTDEMLKIFSAATISLNLHSSSESALLDPQADFVNPRLFELAACGAFQLTDARPGIAEFFTPGSEIITFSDAAGMRAAVEYFLLHADERQAIAQRARARALRDHTYDQRLSAMLAHISRHTPRLLSDPGQSYRTVADIRNGLLQIDPALATTLATLPVETSLTLDAVRRAQPVPLGNPQTLNDPQALLLLLEALAGSEWE